MQLDSRKYASGKNRGNSVAYQREEQRDRLFCANRDERIAIGQRLKQWCHDLNDLQHVINYDFVYVDEENFKKYRLKSFSELMKNFIAYKGFT